MAKSSGLAQRLFAGGFQVSGDIAAINELRSPRGVYIVTAIDKTAQERILGHVDGLIDASSWFNDASGQEHAIFKQLLTTNVHVIYGFGATIGATAAGLVSKQFNYDFTRPIDGSLSLNVRAAANGFGLEWGEMLTAGVRTDTTATNGSSLDNSAATSNGAAAYLQVFAFTGTSVTVAIQDSTDDSAWTTRMTFTAVSGANQQERITWSGSPARYLRVITTGTFSNAEFAVMLRRGSAQDHTAYV